MNATHPVQAGLRPVAGPVPIGAFVSGHFGNVAAWQIPADPRSVPQAAPCVARPLSSGVSCLDRMFSTLSEFLRSGWMASAGSVRAKTA
jgi:hypothetical protein